MQGDKEQKIILLFVLIPLLLLWYCSKNPAKSEESPTCPIPLAIGNRWIYRYISDKYNYTNTIQVSDTTVIGGKKAYKVAFPWPYASEAWVWDEPLIKVYYELDNIWNSFMAFRTPPDTTSLAWGTRTSKIVNTSCSYQNDKVTYSGCVKYNVTYSGGSYEVYIKEGIGFIDGIIAGYLEEYEIE